MADHTSEGLFGRAWADARWGVQEVGTSYELVELDLVHQLAYLNSYEDGDQSGDDDGGGGREQEYETFLSVGLEMWNKDRNWWARKSQKEKSSRCPLLFLGTLHDAHQRHEIPSVDALEECKENVNNCWKCTLRSNTAVEIRKVVKKEEYRKLNTKGDYCSNGDCATNWDVCVCMGL